MQKFNAWDKIENKMCLVTKIDWVEEIVVLSYGRLFTEEHEEYERNFDDVELMQYTGLKDKNGQEIYEGDILHYWGKDSCGTPRDNIVEVEFYKGTFNIGSVWGYTGEHFYDMYECEVIGNKYENPELLEGKS